MSNSNKIAKSTLIIVFFSLGSKFLGFFRETLIAAKFGSGVETDTFLIALTATGLISGFLSNAIGTTFIPILSEIEAKEGKEGKISHTNNMINIISLVSILLVIGALFLAPFIVKVLAKGFEGEQFDLAVKLTRMGLPMIVFSGIIGAFTGYLQSEGRFTSPAAVGISSNLIYVFFLIFLSGTFGITGLIVVAVLASFSRIITQLPEAISIGYKYEFEFDLKDKYVKRLLLLSLPVLVGVAINDINVIVDKTLASNLVDGSISVLNYASKLNGLILGVFISAITTVIFPLLSKESNKDNMDGIKRIMGKGIDLLLVITVPAAVGLAVLSTPIVQVAFERGEFLPRDTAKTVPALVAYSVGLVAMALRLLLNRVYYSLQDTKTPMVNAGISLVFNVVLSLILVQFMDHVGLALATSIATTIASLLLLYGLKEKIGSLGTIGYIKTFIKTGIASGIMGLVAYLIYNGVYSALGVSKLYNLISLLLAAGVGAILYGILCYLFRVDEVIELVDKVIKRVKR